MFIKTLLVLSLIILINKAQSYNDTKWQTRKDEEPTHYRQNNKLNCTTKYTNEIIQLIIDYALWRNIAMLYIVDESIHSGCNMKAIRQHLNCFVTNGLFVTLKTKFPRYKTPTNIHEKPILVVSFIGDDTDFGNYLEMVNALSHWDERFKLLTISPKAINTTIEKRTLDVLMAGELTLSVGFVIAIRIRNSTQSDKTRYTDGCRKFQYLSKTVQNTNVATLLPFNKTLENNQTYNVTFKSLCGESYDFYTDSLCILQIYKIRKTNNASVVVRPLGFWGYEVGTAKMKPYQSLEKRINLHGFQLIFGKKKFSQDANVVRDENLIEDDNDEHNIDKISDFISSFLNAKQKIKTYTTLGLKGASGNWSGLLGGIIAQEVDVGLDSVIKVPERYNNMFFTHDIMISIRNIYVKPVQSHSARNIFFAPFGPQLLLSVIGTGIISAIVMAIYILAHKIHVQKGPPLISYLFATSDAILWILGVLSMQGSLIQPRFHSGNIIVVVLLVFALIIYNSYSAFITSMLSVKLPQIRTLDDLLQSDYDIGYTKNSQDEIYLRSMNETKLNQIYLRGYLHNNINNITDGLLKVTKGNYGFFATGHAARKQFLKISSYKCKYDIMEIPVLSTINAVAFPMALTSPYRKAVNLGLIRMKETGVHNYIESLIAPNLPPCDTQTTYSSAGINDLIISFGLLGLGVVTGILIILFECFWKKKKLVYAKLRGTSHRNFQFIR